MSFKVPWYFVLPIALAYIALGVSMIFTFMVER